MLLLAAVGKGGATSVSLACLVADELGKKVLCITRQSMYYSDGRDRPENTDCWQRTQAAW